MAEQAVLQNYLVLGAILFAVGLVGLLARRNMIVMFLCAEMMLQGVSLSLVAWGRYHNDWGGQMLVVFIITVAACEAAVGLALILMLVRGSGKLDSVVWQDMREDNQPPYADHEVPEFPADEHVWPTLTPAGREPVRTPAELERERHRTRV